MRKTWILASTLLLASACNDDDERSIETADGGQDAAVTGDAARADSATSDPTDAGNDAGDIDSGLVGDAGNIDASMALDATLPDAAADASADAAVDASMAPELAVIGRWHTQFHYVETITATNWTGATIVEFDNTVRVAYVQSTASESNPIAGFSRYVWTPIANNSFWYCTEAFGKPTLAAAKASPEVSNGTDPANEGCGGGPWTAMGPTIEIEGVYSTDDGTLAITSDKLGNYVIDSYDNPTQLAIIGVTGDDDTTVISYSKLAWTTPVTNKVYGCFVASGAATPAEAKAASGTADPGNLATGCNGSAWISLTKQ